MDKAEVETNMLKAYPEYIKRISTLIELCLKKAYKSKNSAEWIKNDDVRFTFYGKYINVLNATRISLFQNITFLSQPDWVDTYNKNFSIQDKKNDFIYLKELDTHSRFSSFMGIASQFEATTLIIIRHLKNKDVPCSDNYGNFLSDQLKLNEWKDFITIVRHLRNTIHNNGIFTKEDETIVFNELKYEFKNNKSVTLSWTECFIIYQYLVELADIVFHHELVAKEDLIKDIVAGALA